MPKTLIVGEIQQGMLRESTLELVAAARGLGGDVVSLLIGNGIQELAEELSKKGGGKVLVADNPEFENYTVDAYAQAIQGPYRFYSYGDAMAIVAVPRLGVVRMARKGGPISE